MRLTDDRHLHRQRRRSMIPILCDYSFVLEQPMTGRASITPREAQELQSLNTEYFDATRRAAEAMRTGGAPLVGAALDTVLEADRRAETAMRRIKAIHGI
jgi:hypothetical protein